MQNFKPTLSYEEEAMIEYIDKHKGDIFFDDVIRESNDYELVLKFEFGEMKNCFIAKDYGVGYYMVLNGDHESWRIERSISKKLFDYLELLINRSRWAQLEKNHLIKIDQIFN